MIRPFRLIWYIMIATALIAAQEKPQSVTEEKLADTRISSISTLEELLEYAYTNNPKVSQAYYDWQASLQAATHESALPNPQLSYGYFVKEVETRVGQHNQKIGLSQTFPFPGKLGSKKAFGLKKAAADSTHIVSEKLHVARELKKNWYEYAYVIRATNVLKLNIQFITSLENVVREKYRSGKSPYASLVRIQLERERLNSRLQNMLELEEPIKAALNATLNRSPDAILPRPKALPLPSAALSDSVWQKQLRDHNPDLQAGKQLIEMQNAGVRLADKSKYPDITIAVEYIDTGASPLADISDSGKDPILAQVSFSLPIWWGKNKAESSEARAKQRAAVYSYQSKERYLLSTQRMVLYRLNEARRNINLFSKSLIPRTRQVYEVTLSAFESGSAGFSELLDIQRSLLDLELLLQRALADYNQHLTELETLSPKAAYTREN